MNLKRNVYHTIINNSNNKINNKICKKDFKKLLYFRRRWKLEIIQIEKDGENKIIVGYDFDNNRHIIKKNSLGMNPELKEYAQKLNNQSSPLYKKHKKHCKHKVRHKSYDDAKIALHNTLNNNFIYHRMNIYKCFYCNGWHLGRTKKILYGKFKGL